MNDDLGPRLREVAARLEAPAGDLGEVLRSGARRRLLRIVGTTLGVIALVGGGWISAALVGSFETTGSGLRPDTAGGPSEGSSAASASPSPAGAEGRVVVTRTDGARYIEGSVSFIRLSYDDGRNIVLPALGPGPDPVAKQVPVGRVTVEHKEQPCVGTCEGLDPPVNRCSTRALVDEVTNLRLKIHIEGSRCSVEVVGEHFALPYDGQDPAEVGVPYRFRILSHCGLGHPIQFDGRYWLPVLPRYRETINPPPGFDQSSDTGKMTLDDEDTATYESSGGTRVEYEPAEPPSRQFMCD